MEEAAAELGPPGRIFVSWPGNAAADGGEAGRRCVRRAASQDEGRWIVAEIDEQSRRLAALREEIAASEALNLDFKISAAALSRRAR